MTESPISCPRCGAPFLVVEGEASTKQHFTCGSTLIGGTYANGPGCTNQPSVGRIVHYQSYGTPKGEYDSLARAAVVTQVNEDGTVGLFIMNPTGVFFPTSVRHANPPKAGCWSWPPRS